MASLKWESLDVTGAPKAMIPGNSTYDFGATTLFLRAELPHGWLVWVQPIPRGAQWFYIPDPTKSWGKSARDVESGSSMSETIRGLLEMADSDGPGS